MGSLAELALRWSRPAALAALALPVLLLLLARLRTRPPLVATGTLALWERAGAETQAVSRASRPRIPLSSWLLALALAGGALALAGPRIVAARGARTWTVMVDHAPSTGLAWLAREGEPSGGEPTRLERAAASAAQWLAANAGELDRVVWTSAAREPVELAPGEEPPASWLAPVRQRAPRPELTRYDRPGSLLVTDRAPDPPPSSAGWFASGGAAVHGPVALDAEGLWSWNGEMFVLQELASGAGTLVLDEREAALPARVRAIALDWAAARGLAVASAEDSPSNALLVVRAVLGEGAPREVEVGRDGWRALAAAPADGIGAPRSPASLEGSSAEEVLEWRSWLTAVGESLEASEPAFVLAAPGRVDVALATLEAPSGDPAAFALSWAELLDSAALHHPDVVPLADRAGAGPPSSRAPLEPPAESPASAAARIAFDAWLAGLAALLALLSLALER